MKIHTIGLKVGLFFIIVAAALLFSFTFSDWSDDFDSLNTYRLKAEFHDIGSLRIGSVVKLSGVSIGKVKSIHLTHDYQAIVGFEVKKSVKIPDDSEISVVTQGVLGGNYLSITPGFDEQYLQPNQMVVKSHSAFILEKMIGQALLRVQKKEKHEK